MSFFIIGIILILISIFLFIKTKQRKDNNDILKREEEKIQQQIKEKEIKKEELDKTLNIFKERLQESQDILKNQKNLLNESFTQYIDLLEEQYKKEEKSYDDAIDAMRWAYDQQQDILIKETDNIKQDLEKIRITRASAQEALLKEEKIKKDMSFYSLNPSQEDIDDIQTLERIKNKLHQPRILCMLIWSTYFQKPMTQLCNNILGVKETCGIYKITNQETNQCYIGQSVDIAKRWKDHIKCGLGIDTPANNKLYQSMAEYGVWNFTFEVLEECPRSQLNEKERFYIDLYQANEFGFNSNTGIKK